MFLFCSFSCVYWLHKLRTCIRSNIGFYIEFTIFHLFFSIHSFILSIFTCVNVELWLFQILFIFSNYRMLFIWAYNGIISNTNVDEIVCNALHIGRLWKSSRQTKGHSVWSKSSFICWWCKIYKLQNCFQFWIISEFQSDSNQNNKTF